MWSTMSSSVLKAAPSKRLQKQEAGFVHVRGARVRTLVDTRQPSGRYRVEWDGRDSAGTPVGSGVYFYRLATSHFSGTRKMLLLK